jgi:small subunit ribosomal protein S16
MAVKIRLRQQGRNNCQTYRVVATDSRNPRDGKYLEMLGWYNPAQDKDNLFMDAERLNHWIAQGAVVSDRVQSLMEKAAPQVLKEMRDRGQQKRVKLARKRREAKK